MGAIASTVFALCSAGDHIVAQRQLYAGTSAFLLGPCARLGIDVTFVDGTEPGAFAAAVRPGKTMLVIAETPSNPRSTSSTSTSSARSPARSPSSTRRSPRPIGQQPIATASTSCCTRRRRASAATTTPRSGVVAGERELLDAIWAYAVLHGACASPFDALNGLRGVRTLAVRHRHQSAGGSWDRRGARRTIPASPPSTTPACPTTPSTSWRPSSQMMPASSPIDLAGGVDAARVTLDSLRVARSATSLGGPETLVCHPATSTHVSLLPEDQAAIGITAGLLRISIGLEDPADVIADLCQAIPPDTIPCAPPA